jgi:hypothetical protein
MIVSTDQETGSSEFTIVSTDSETGLSEFKKVSMLCHN